VKTTTSWLSIDEEPGPKTTNTADKHEEPTTPDEEATKLDQDEEVTQATEATATGTANTATFARSKDIVKKNARSESRKINPAAMPKDATTGPRFTSWRKSTPLITKRSDLSRETVHLTLPGSQLEQELQPLPRNSRVFSKELYDSPHPSS
jgi:hypothetical protein